MVALGNDTQDRGRRLDFRSFFTAAGPGISGRDLGPGAVAVSFFLKAQKSAKLRFKKVEKIFKKLG